MKVNYDKEADAIYLEIQDGQADGVVEIKEGINIDLSKDGRILGIELLDASKKISLDSFLSYQVTPDFFKASA